jgi:hypothetical protein
LTFKVNAPLRGSHNEGEHFSKQWAYRGATEDRHEKAHRAEKIGPAVSPVSAALSLVALTARVFQGVFQRGQLLTRMRLA